MTLKKILRKRLKLIVDHWHIRLNAPHQLGHYHCPVCNQDVRYFNRLPDYYFEELDKNLFIHSIFKTETCNFLKYSCPKCNADDRARLYALYFNKFLKENNNKFKLLDIAPSKPLKNFLLKQPNINYRSADLSMSEVDDKVDITDMKIYQEATFDIVICSHVLEHVEQDTQAIAEIYRILRPQGWAIVMTPILLSLSEDYEIKNIHTPADRWRHYGQHDHVRIYSKDGFIGKLKCAGFKLFLCDSSFFGKGVFQKAGIHERSVLYIAQK